MMTKNLLGGALLAALVMAGGSAQALEPAASTSYRISYAGIVPGGATLSGTTFKAPASGTGQTLTRLQSAQQLPVSLSGFTIE